MSQPVSSAVAQIKWTWQAVGRPPPVRTPMNLKLKAAIQAVVMTAVGFILRHFHKDIGAGIVWTLAALVLVGGLFYPPLFHGFEKFGQKLAKWVAAGLTWGLLVPFFYLCFLPGRLIMALSGKDPMTRKFPSDAATYWIPRRPVPNLNQYKKQH